MNTRIGVLYIGDVLHRILLRCEGFSHDCLRRVVDTDTRQIMPDTSHGGVEVYSCFRRTDEQIVGDELLRPVIGHLICNIGGHLLFHEDEEAEWLTRSFRNIRLKGTIQALLVVCSSQAQLREAVIRARPWFQPAPESPQPATRGTPRRWKCLLIANGHNELAETRDTDT